MRRSELRRFTRPYRASRVPEVATGLASGQQDVLPESVACQVTSVAKQATHIPAAASRAAAEGWHGFRISRCSRS